MAKLKGYKGFDKDLKCRGYQYTIGNIHTTESKIKCCTSGFHFCTDPFDVFTYYPPCSSRYCSVVSLKEGACPPQSDSKVVTSQLLVESEIGLNGIIEYGIKSIFSNINWQEKKTNTGNQSAATNTGNRSAATNTGYKSAANVGGVASIACGLGVMNKVKGAIGCWLVLAEWHKKNSNYHLKSVETAKVDGKEIKADTWYTLKNGKFIQYGEE